MPRGLVYHHPVSREDTPIGEVFQGHELVTRADIAMLVSHNITTAKEFAKAASDGDLTDNGLSPLDSIRLINQFEESDYSDLLDYAAELASQTTQEQEPEEEYQEILGGLFVIPRRKSEKK